MKPLCDATIAMVGLGLMGGSLAGALRPHCRSIVGVGRQAQTIEAALARGLVDRGTTDLASGVRQADVVILATPVRVILSLLDEIGPLLRQDCLLMDLGSAKAQIVARMTRLPGHVQPLGGHPMCGREASGIASADPALYRNHLFVLTPLPRTSDDTLALGRALVAAIGARPLVLDADRHDRLAAAISHLPYLLACGLVGTAEQADSDPLTWELAASGFRDASRLASSDVTMMLDILLTNREAVMRALSVCQAQLDHLSRRIETGDEDGLRSALTAVCERRRSLFT